ncbi:hypothetical protein D3C84_813930 [compost metagenome]
MVCISHAEPLCEAQQEHVANVLWHVTPGSKALESGIDVPLPAGDLQEPLAQMLHELQAKVWKLNLVAELVERCFGLTKHAMEAVLRGPGEHCKNLTVRLLQ